MKARLLVLIALLSMTSPAWATLSIPSDLSDGEQLSLLQILGFGTSFRPVDNPYPLGGYSGLELGLGMESLSTEDIGYYGSKAAITRNVIYPRITIGKGIYNSLDVFFSFIPLNDSNGVGIYSGALRWGFFQATFVPAVFSFLVSATNTNISNLVISQTEEADLVAGVNVDPISFYVGAGAVYGQGQFDPAITWNGASTNQVGDSFHTMIGLNLAISQIFTSIELDSYNTTTLSLKVGTRL